MTGTSPVCSMCFSAGEELGRGVCLADGWEEIGTAWACAPQTWQLGVGSGKAILLQTALSCLFSPPPLHQAISHTNLYFSRLFPTFFSPASPQFPPSCMADTPACFPEPPS